MKFAILTGFGLLFVGLEVNSYTRKSATWDEPIHLTSGYAALAHDEYRMDPSHPPLARMWAALPLLLVGATPIDVARIDRAVMPRWLEEAYGYSHDYLYTDNDADRLLYAARFMTVLLGLLLGWLLFSWVDEWLGATAATIALAVYLLEPNLAAHATLVTTDFPLTCFVFGAAYFLWRTCRVFTLTNLAGLAVFFALAVISKFSGILLVPIIGTLLVLAVARRRLPARDALFIAGVLMLATYVAIWMAYGFRFAPGPTATWSFHFQDGAFAQHAPGLARVVGWIDDHQLLPNAFTQGFLYSQGSVRELGAFLAGQYSTDGWWYYFPVALSLKTPLSLMALVALGIILWSWKRRQMNSSVAPFVVVPVIVFFGGAMASGINIGLRHILPIYPFLLLVAAAAAHLLVTSGTRARAAIAVAVLLAAVEFGTVYPHNLTFFNRLAGGPRNGFRYLSDSNLGWGQNLKPLRAWMTRNGVTHINLAYFGQADPAYYGIDCTYLPGSPSFAIDAITRPRLPGYVAISSTVLSGVYLQPAWRLFYRPFNDLQPAAVVGNSIRVYWVEQWPETTGRAAEGSNIDVHRALADRLLFAQEWPTRAARHYREYLKQRPDDQRVLVNAAMALLLSGDMAAAIALLRHAIDLDPDNGDAQLILAKALLGARDLEGARLHAERAVILLAANPDAYDLLGRVRAVEGRFGEAARYYREALAVDPAFAPAGEHLHELEAWTRR